MGASGDVTALLRAWGGGDLAARDRLVPVVYRELRRRAEARIKREWRQTLQPTDLVHEAYLHLVDQQRAVWRNRAQFYAVAAEIMRRILVDRARAHNAAKRSGQWARVTLDPGAVCIGPLDLNVLDLDAALQRLATIDERKSKVAELRLIGGLSLEEAADALDLSIATVERDWQFARAWLIDALSSPSADESDR